MANRGSTLRPPRQWPALADELRRSLSDRAGRVARLWIEEYVPIDPSQAPGFLLAAEVRGFDPGQQLSDEVRGAIAEDLHSRVVDESSLSEADCERTRIAVFAPGEHGSLTGYLRETEPVFGESKLRMMDRVKLRTLLPAPRELPDPHPVREDQIGNDIVWLALAMIAAVGAGLAALAWWLIPWLVVRGIVAAVCLLFAGAAMYLLWMDSPKSAMRRPRQLRELPMTLAAVVQAFEALWVPEHPDYPHGARYGLVALYTLDPERRDDPAWLNWLARRLAWLRDHSAETPEETRIAQRLEGEADDGTSRIPPSVAGNDATYWASPRYLRSDLPGDYLPPDGLLPILIEAGAQPGQERVHFVRPWPAELWPLRLSPPWANRPELEVPDESDSEAERAPQTSPASNGSPETNGSSTFG